MSFWFLSNLWTNMV